MTIKWKGGEHIPFDYSGHIKGTGSRKYIKARQCAALYTKGGRAGYRCSWYAQEGRIYCRRHGGYEGRTLSAEHEKNLHDGAKPGSSLMISL